MPLDRGRSDPHRALPVILSRRASIEASPGRAIDLGLNPSASDKAASIAVRSSVRHCGRTRDRRRGRGRRLNHTCDRRARAVGSMSARASLSRRADPFPTVRHLAIPVLSCEHQSSPPHPTKDAPIAARDLGRGRRTGSWSTGRGLRFQRSARAAGSRRARTGERPRQTWQMRSTNPQASASSASDGAAFAAPLRTAAGVTPRPFGDIADKREP